MRRVGGLADTVVDASDRARRVGNAHATGFVFDHATASALSQVIERVIDAYAEPALRLDLMRHGMALDFSWNGAAQQYLALHRGRSNQRDGNASRNSAGSESKSSSCTCSPPFKSADESNQPRVSGCGRNGWLS
ncbi:MAG: hypothetical protein Q7T97_13195 [Burkholderiaceae bacterium]|nr:hypothetical protein [Burkholderiaceae bacterium]